MHVHTIEKRQPTIEEKRDIWSIFFDWMIPPEIKERGGEELRQARLLVGLSSPLILLCFMSIFPMLMVGGSNSSIFLVNTSTFFGYSFVIVLLWRSRGVRQPAILLCALMFLGYIGMIAATGGYSSFLLYWSGATVLIALLLLGVRWGGFYAFMAMIAVFVFFAIDANGGTLLPNIVKGLNAEEANRLLKGARLFLLLSFLSFVATVGWVFEISRRKAMEEREQMFAENKELVVARNIAEASDRAKSEFLATMSHELRTPLNAIIGYSEILEEEARDEDMPHFIEDLVKIHGSGRHLLSLINDLLDLSKIEAGKMEIDLDTFSLTSLVEELGQIVAPSIAKNGNRLDIDLEDADIEMVSDCVKVKQIVLNLLSNAAKFTHEGDVSLSLWREQREGRDWVLCEIRDSGIGISLEQQTRLFKMFSQVDSSSSRKYGGSGLGLAIVKRLCELLGGDVSVESEAGEGSVFTVQLPQALSEGDLESIGAELKERRVSSFESLGAVSYQV